MKNMKYVLGTILVLGFCICFHSTDASAAKISFGKSSITVTKGSTKKVKLKNVKKKVKWKIKNGKLIKIKSKKGKYKNTVTISGKKTGKTTVIAIVGKKQYKLKVKVVPKKTVNKPESNVQEANIDCAVEFDMGMLNVELTNSSSKTAQVKRTDFELLKLEGDKWVNALPEGTDVNLTDDLCTVNAGQKLTFTLNLQTEFKSGIFTVIDYIIHDGKYKYIQYYSDNGKQKSVETVFEIK
ncbi:MAG: hypothetical protein IKN54_05070 [Lachnospiraceae bacterium]|nr:hypothetical protein [Lachnospiraceae bacterium]